MDKVSSSVVEKGRTWNAYEMRKLSGKTYARQPNAHRQET